MHTVTALSKKSLKHMNCMNKSGKDCLKCLLYKACNSEGNYADRINKAAEGLE